MSAEENLGEAVLILSTNNNGLRMGIDEAQVAAAGMQEKLDGMQNHMQDRFAEKFEHVGVHLFGHDMLQAVGITQGARPIIGAMQMGINALADSMGVATGPIGLVVFGLTALAAIGYKLYESHEKHTEGLEKLIKKQEEEFKKSIDLKDKLEEYEKVLGHLPPKLDAFRDATAKLLSVQTEQSSHQMGKAMAASLAHSAALQKEKDTLELMLRTQIASVTVGLNAEAALRAENSARNSFAERLADIDVKMKEEHKNYETLKVDIAAHKAGSESAMAALEKQAKAEEKLAADRKLAAEEKKKYDDVTLLQGKHILDMEQQGAMATTDAYAKKSAEIKKYQIDQQHEIDKLHEMQLASARSGAQILAANQQYAAANIALAKTVAAKQQENYTAVGQAAIAVGKTIENSVTSVAGKALVSGKLTHDTLVAMSTQVAEQIATDALKAGVSYVVQAIKGKLMHDAIAAAAVESAAIQVKANAAVILSNQAKTASVVELTGTLGKASIAAYALDAAMAAAV